MNKVIIALTNGIASIYDIQAGLSAEQIALSFGPQLREYLEFSASEFDEDCYNFPSAFSLDNGVISFNLDRAKQLAETLVNNQSNEQAAKNLLGLSYDVYMAQCALPSEQRIAKYQAAIDANNALAIETENREQAIYAASTIQEVNSIVYPPKD